MHQLQGNGQRQVLGVMTDTTPSNDSSTQTITEGGDLADTNLCSDDFTQVGQTTSVTRSPRRLGNNVSKLRNVFEFSAGGTDYFNIAAPRILDNDQGTATPRTISEDMSTTTSSTRASFECAIPTQTDEIQTVLYFPNFDIATFSHATPEQAVNIGLGEIDRKFSHRFYECGQRVEAILGGLPDLHYEGEAAGNFDNTISSYTVAEFDH